MNLHKGLTVIAGHLNLDAAALISYAKEDTVGGGDPGGKWESGSVWSVEGQILYALTRALKPQRVIEIGTWAGCSASHFLAALNANGEGELYSFDLTPVHGNGPALDRQRWHFVQAEAEQWLTEHRMTADLVFEDATHETEDTERLLRAIVKCRPSLIISHDVMHVRVGPQVRQAWDSVFGDGYHTIRVDPSDCGLAYVGF